MKTQIDLIQDIVVVIIGFTLGDILLNSNASIENQIILVLLIVGYIYLLVYFSHSVISLWIRLMLNGIVIIFGYIIISAASYYLGIRPFNAFHYTVIMIAGYVWFIYYEIDRFFVTARSRVDQINATVSNRNNNGFMYYSLPKSKVYHVRSCKFVYSREIKSLAKVNIGEINKLGLKPCAACIHHSDTK